MSKKKIQIYALIKWIEEDTYDIIRRSDIQVSCDQELEFNSIYSVNYDTDIYEAEYLYEGSQSDCNKVYDLMAKQKKHSKTNTKTTTPKKSAKKVIEECIENQENAQKSCKKITLDTCLKQLEDRDMLINDYKVKQEQNENKIQSLNDELKCLKMISGIFFK